MVSAMEALANLQAGNRRFVANEHGGTGTCPVRRTALVDGQAPSAIILGCSDSRVPVEIVFDQGLGDLFVVRVAGNIVASSLVGSIEFAAERFGTRLVVVLGHSRCGAVKATIEALECPAPVRSENLYSIVDRIRPAVETLIEAGCGHGDIEILLHHAVRANIRASVNHLRHGSPTLERLIALEGLIVVGAEYCLDSGEVEFFDGVSEGYSSTNK